MIICRSRQNQRHEGEGHVTSHLADWLAELGKKFYTYDLAINPCDLTSAL